MKSHWHSKRRVRYNEAELRKTVGIIAVVAMCLLALSYIAGVPKAYLASLGVNEKVSKDIKVEFGKRHTFKMLNRLICFL